MSGFSFRLLLALSVAKDQPVDSSRETTASALGGRGGGASSSMLRVTLWEVRKEEDAVQSSLSPSGEISRVAAVLELSPSVFARSSRDRNALWRREGRKGRAGREGVAVPFPSADFRAFRRKENS